MLVQELQYQVADLHGCLTGREMTDALEQPVMIDPSEVLLRLREV